LVLALCLSDWITTFSQSSLLSLALALGWSSWSSFLGWSLTLLEASKLSDFVASLLSADHDLESVQVSGLASKCESIHFLESRSGLPLLFKVESLGSLSDSASSSSSEKWNSQLSQSQSSEWINASWEALKSFNENSVGVGNVDDDNALAIVFTVINVTNSTCFNEVSNALNYQNNELLLALSLTISKCNFILNNNGYTRHSF
jgi:hypothetical protein